MPSEPKPRQPAVARSVGLRQAIMGWLRAVVGALRNSRTLRSAAFGLLIGAVAGGGMYVHDGAPLADALAGFAGFFAFGFALVYVPILARIGAIIALIFR